MANVFTAMFLFIASLSMFSFSTLYGAVHRTFLGIDEVMVREAVNAVDFNRPYFDFNLSYDIVADYFESNLASYKPFIKYEYDVELDDVFKVGSIFYPTSFFMRFEAKFDGYVYRNTLSYKIVEGELKYNG